MATVFGRYAWLGAATLIAGGLVSGCTGEGSTSSVVPSAPGGPVGSAHQSARLIIKIPP